MEIRLTFGRKNRFPDFSSQDGKCLIHNRLSGLFKEIPRLISLNNISLISILQRFIFKAGIPGVLRQGVAGRL
jgi:hypothetical protein